MPSRARSQSNGKCDPTIRWVDNEINAERPRVTLPLRVNSKLEQAQRHAAVNGASISCEESLLTGGLCGGFAGDHLAGRSVFHISDVIQLEKEFGKPNPAIIDLHVLMDICGPDEI